MQDADDLANGGKEYCCDKFKEELRTETAIIYSAHYRSFYIHYVELASCSYGSHQVIGDIKIDYCPFCGAKL